MSFLLTPAQRLPMRTRQLILTALAIIAVAVALSPLPTALRWIALALVGLVYVVDIRSFITLRQGGSDWPAVSRVRWSALLAGAVIWAWLGGGSTMPIMVVASVIVLALAVPPQSAGHAPYAHQLPGFREGPAPVSPISTSAFPAATLAAALLLAALSALRAPGWLVIAYGVTVVAGLAVASDSFTRPRLQALQLARALRVYNPVIGIGYAGRSGGPWQLRMWEPYLLRSGLRCVIFNVHVKYKDMILADGGLQSPFVQLGSAIGYDLGRLLVPSLRTLYYVQNAQTNAAFMAHQNVTHVWLNHGDSDKPANFNPRHAHYDKLVVCGQAGIDRYVKHGIDIDPQKFEILGRPQADAVEAPGFRVTTEQVVLYAPTWQGLDTDVNFSSLERGAEIVLHLIARGATVIFRPHPLSYRWRIRRGAISDIQAILELDSQLHGRQHVWGERAEKRWSVVDCANAADALISDVSSVVSDFLQSTKPYAMVSMRAGIEDFRAEYTVAQTGYVLLGDLSNLDEVLDDLLDADPLAEARVERKKYVLGDFDGDESAEAFTGFVRALATG